MLRLIKWAILAVLCAALVVLGVANMAPVDLYLVPPGIVRTDLMLSGIPLAVVILAAILLGVVIGELFEWLREHKHRRRASERSREVERLKAEIATLKRRLGDKDDMPRIAAQ
ncbi:lipopolysaccharide assembly protein LapA domain-containing protein [Limibaculum sp. FT325]|uniref:lipopolysaccharide assembly protein LapA domain-containing protein n=1 Tax=Thermohalobaculum sediminis TaxID=2939436 RepID=UPI0020BE5AE1|nr:lipopolysaccharide assembly protein LapA domain-containing protein [Limibaculum sediminis]MCL5776605.1 lipopolysaccharide assembly protein LapA domain-containing protein [Limibaculum sediminis]